MLVKRGAFYREPFDPTREFVVYTAMVVGGELLKPGTVVDKRQFGNRRLRQLYEGRKLVMSGYVDGAIRDVPGGESGRDVTPNFDAMPDYELTEYLELHDVVPRPNASHTWLVTKCLAVFEAQKAASPPSPAAAEAA